MHARALEISWHEKTCVWSVDVSLFQGVTRLVSAGSDKVVRIWRLPNATSTSVATTKATKSSAAPDGTTANVGDDIKIEWLSDLRAHTSNVNAVRFSPGGDVLATAADGGEIVLWKLDPRASTDVDGDKSKDGGGSGGAPAPAFGAPPGSDAPKERWTCLRTLRGHAHDVLDMSWSPCGTLLSSASVDNQVMIWNINSSGRPCALHQFNNYVQGVAFSPDGTRLGTLGNDRTLRIFNRSKLAKNGTSTWKPTATVNNFGSAKLFVDDMNSKNLVRRLAWSPDGNLLACPSGLDLSASIAKESNRHINSNNKGTATDGNMNSTNGIPAAPVATAATPTTSVNNVGNTNTSKTSARGSAPGKRLYAAHIFSRNAPQIPLFQCGNLSKPVISVRFSPVLYRLRKLPSDIAPAVPLNYRMVFAVLCTDAMFLYDTQSTNRPIARVSGLHLAEHTDGCWTPDGSSFFISSTDGYVSCTSFEDGELGEPLPKSEYPLIRFIPAPSPAPPAVPAVPNAPSAAPNNTSPAIANPNVTPMEKT